MERADKASKWGWLSKLFARKNGRRGRTRVNNAAEAAMENAEKYEHVSPPPYKSFPAKDTVLKVAAINGSLAKKSNNLGLINAAIEIAGESIPGLEIELVSIADLPILNTDLVVDETYPEAVETFRKKIQESDAILFATPEYVYSVTGALKNAIDWVSLSPNVVGRKVAAVMTAAGDLGGARAQYHLRQMGVNLNLFFVNKPEVFVNSYESPKKFDADGNLIDEGTRESVKRLLFALQQLALKLRW